MDQILNLSPDSTQVRPPPATKKKLPRFLVNFLSIFFIIISLLSILLFFFVFLPAKKVYDHITPLKASAATLQQSVSAKDINQIKENFGQIKIQISSLESDYLKLKAIGSLPYLNNYYRDGEEFISIAKNGLDTGEIVVKAIEPYQDFLGFKGTATDSAKTTEDRINFLTESVEGLLPHLDVIQTKIASIEQSFDRIDPSRYPEEYQGIQIQANLLKARQLTSETHKFIRDGRPILAKTSWLLGKDKPRNYFLIFQNDAELRPTGGFWTAYGLIKVDKGKISPSVSEDIYTLDAKFNSTIPAPRPIKSYHINVPYWNLRDMNLSPDFPTSIETFLGHYAKISDSREKIDAVIAIDTKVLVDIVGVLGRVGVPGFGNFSTDPDKRCDGCPQIIYQLEWIAGRPRNYIEKDRKGFLSPLMHSLLSNALGSEKSKIGPLVQVLGDNIVQKHILFYFIDPEIEKAAVLANITGSITQTDEGVDYFHLNDANMSSAKTNLFLKQKIKHEIISQNNKIDHKVTVTYTNPSKASNCNLEKGDLCLNAPKYRNWFRFYVPKGSVIQKMTGSEIEPLNYEELGKQVFEGFYGDKYPLYAQSSLKTSIQYTTSVPPSSNYTLVLQKQPGTKPIEYELIVNGKKQESFSWASDKIIKLSL
ncbi:MAG: DUF4012 domain-containing protein [Candidatus Shapirobacteria bacterium]|jgi:hypothetical protein